MLYRFERHGLVCAAILLASCGATQAQGTLTHDYELNGSYADALGGPSLGHDGGTFDANLTQYVFGANQGLTLSNGLSNSAGNNGNYSIETRFQFTTTNGYRKILDVKNLTVDAGLYNLDNTLNFYPSASGGTLFSSSNPYADVVLSRNGSNNVVTGYVNGAQVFSFTDSSGAAIFNSANNIIRFFEDDTATSQGEASAGSVDRIRIFDGAVNQAQVTALYNNTFPIPMSGASVPEASTLLCFGSLVGMGGAILRRRRANV